MPGSRAEGSPLAPMGLVLVSLAGLQAGGALATTLYGTVGVPGAVTLRLSFAAVVLLVVRRPTLRMSRRQWALVVAVGAVLCTHHLAFFGAIARIPLGTATTVEFLGPFLLSVALSRRWHHGAWACLALVGVALLTRPSLGVDGLGLALAGLAAAAWASYIVLARGLSREGIAGPGLALALTVGAVLSLPFGVPALDGHLTDPAVLLRGAGVAVLSSVLPYSLQLAALHRLAPRPFSVLLSMEPAVAALVGLLALGQSLSVAQWAGIAAVVTASVMSCLAD